MLVSSRRAAAAGRLGKPSLVGEPEIQLKRGTSSADPQAAPATIADAMGESLGRVAGVEDEPSVRDAVLAALHAERFAATRFDDLPDPAALLTPAPAPRSVAAALFGIADSAWALPSWDLTRESARTLAFQVRTCAR
jgi:hypothetical protein